MISRLSEEAFDKCVNGKARLVLLGREVSLKLSPKCREQFAEAKAQGYVIAREDTNLAHAWRVWCDVNRMPDVAIWTHGKRCAVRLDMCPSGKRLPTDFVEVIRPRCKCRICEVGYVWFQWLTLEEAVETAFMLVKASKDV